MLNQLRLVFPPMTNQIADWLWSDAAAREFVKHSKLYMIGQRHELLFENVEVGQTHQTVRFDLVCGAKAARNVIFPFNQFLELRTTEFDFDASPRHMRFSVERDGKQLIRWYWPDSFLYAWWRGQITLQNPPNIRDFTSYDLHYVGISKEGDSFSRLFQNGHENRARILSNASPIAEKARVTDEILLFLFEVQELGFKSWTFGEYAETLGRSATPDPTQTQIVADAEKAFVKILRTEYNRETYSNYPAGKDGLAGANLDRYSYIIDEPITFDTLHDSIRGGHFLDNSDPANMIAIEGEKVELMRFTPPPAS